MTRLLLIFIMCMYALNNMQAYQLIKIPQLVEHFHHHQSDDSEMTFIAFLKMHYKVTAEQDSDHTKDEKLPFKTVENFSAFSVTALPVMRENITTQETVSVKQKFTILSQNSIIPQLVKGLFRPPRLA